MSVCRHTVRSGTDRVSYKVTVIKDTALESPMIQGRTIWQLESVELRYIYREHDLQVNVIR